MSRAKLRLSARHGQALTHAKRPPEAHSSGAGPESYRAFVAGAGWSRQEWVSWVRNTLSRDIFTNAAATRDGLPTSKMTAELNHPDGTGDGSKASILVQLAAHQAPMVASGRPSVQSLNRLRRSASLVSIPGTDPRLAISSGPLSGVRRLTIHLHPSSEAPISTFTPNELTD